MPGAQLGPVDGARLFDAPLADGPALTVHLRRILLELILGSEKKAEMLLEFQDLQARRGLNVPCMEPICQLAGPSFDILPPLGMVPD